MKRRKFILTLVGSAAAIGWTGWKVGTGKAATTRYGSAGLVKVTRSTWALGTEVKLTVFHQDAAQASEAIQQAFKELEQVESIMSLYRSDSEICQLNRRGRLAEAHPYLVQVLERASLLSGQSEGAFDITVQPLYQLYADSTLLHRQPDEEQLRKTLNKIGWDRVKINGRDIHLEGEGTAITLNGIAQGFAADRVTEALKRAGVEHALVDTGEVSTLGDGVEKRDWTIGIKHPRKEHSLLALAQLNGRCLATSGDYETRFGEGFDHHHLLDPHTGKSPLELSSVSVAAPTALEADALSTALFLTGIERGCRLVESIEQVDALFVTKSGRMVQTSGFPLNS